MLDLVAQDDASDVFSVFFVFELGGMDANHHQLVRVLRFELLEIGNDVDAVDAAISPEIQQNDLALECRDRQRFVRIQPATATLDLRRAHPRSFL
jgi:hypothetical protein